MVEQGADLEKLNDEEMIAHLKIVMESPAMDPDHLKKSAYVMIRHGYSLYNYTAAVVEGKYGRQSPQKRELIVSTDFIDPPLHSIGIEQCNKNKHYIEEVHIKRVLVSPMQRCLQTAVEMFKNHPDKENMKFTVIPLFKEVTNNSNDIPRSVAEITTTWAHGEERCKGIKFDFSQLYLFGVPDLWPVYILANFEKQRKIIDSLDLAQI
jgi:hypothetical protein